MPVFLYLDEELVTARLKFFKTLSLSLGRGWGSGLQRGGSIAGGAHWDGGKLLCDATGKGPLEATEGCRKSQGIYERSRAVFRGLQGIFEVPMGFCINFSGVSRRFQN